MNGPLLIMYIDMRECVRAYLTTISLNAHLFQCEQ